MEEKVKQRFVYLVLAIVLIASLGLSACKPTAAVADIPSYNVAFEPIKVEAPNCDYGGTIKSIEAVDELTFKITLCSPDPALPSKVAFTAFNIQDKGYLDANTGDSVKMSEKPNGTGPYIVKEWIRGDHITLESNPNYWGEKAPIKTVIFRWSEQSAQRLLELQSGTVDGIDNPAPEDFETISGDSNLALYPRAALNIFYIGFNNTIPPFDNPDVRKGIALAIDRQRIVDQFYPKGSSVAQNFVPEPFNPGFSKGISWYDRNLDEAKALLAGAGLPEGSEITLSYRNVVRGYLPTPDKVAVEIQAQLAEVGLKVNIEQMESAAFIDATSAGQKGFYLLGWGADYPDATNFYDYHFAAEANLQFGTLYPDLVEEIRAAGKITDVAQRQVHYDKVNELIKQYIPMVPVAHGGSATAFKAEVTGAHSSPLSNELFAVMNNGKDTMVWMQNGEPAALWCSDETDGETLRACEQVYESLLSYEVGGVAVHPGLAETWESNADLTEWTFKLRSGVTFHNGDKLDAGDVVASFLAQWDASSPNHVGRTTTFEYFSTFFGSFLNAPAQ
jgi:ABC-type transport system substrate-binding protein